MKAGNVDTQKTQGQRQTATARNRLYVESQYRYVCSQTHRKGAQTRPLGVGGKRGEVGPSTDSQLKEAGLRMCEDVTAHVAQGYDNRQHCALEVLKVCSPPATLAAGSLAPPQTY